MDQLNAAPRRLGRFCSFLDQARRLTLISRWREAAENKLSLQHLRQSSLPPLESASITITSCSSAGDPHHRAGSLSRALNLPLERSTWPDPLWRERSSRSSQTHPIDGRLRAIGDVSRLSPVATTHWNLAAPVAGSPAGLRPKEIRLRSRSAQARLLDDNCF